MKITFNNHLRRLTISILLILVSYTGVFAKFSKVHELNNKHELVMSLIKGELTPILLKADLTVDSKTLNPQLVLITTPEILMAPVGTATFTYTYSPFCLPDPTGISEPSAPNTSLGILPSFGAYSYKRYSDEYGNLYVAPVGTITGTGGIGELGFNKNTGAIAHNISEAGIYIVTRQYYNEDGTIK